MLVVWCSVTGDSTARQFLGVHQLPCVKVGDKERLASFNASAPVSGYLSSS